jgi:hypothetical protein
MRSGFMTFLSVASFAGALAIGQVAQAATINWKGHTWNVTGGGMAGVCQGSAANISVDASGYLHMKITNNGGTWTAAEIFSTDKIGFGTYQWQIDGPVDKLDKNVVVGLFPYGPAAGMGGSGNNEIDIEYARWGNAAWDNGNWTVWPPTGTGSDSYTFNFSLNGGTYTTSRFVWSSTKIDFATMSGFEPVGSTNGLIKSWTYAPTNPTTKITQAAMPLGMNLWCFDNPPSDGQAVEIIVRDFTFVPLGAALDAGTDGGGGATGTGGTGGLGGGSGGTAGGGGAPGMDAAAGSGGAGGTGGTGGTTEAAAGGRSGSGGSMGNGGAAGTTASGGAAGIAGSRSGGSTGTGTAGTGGVGGGGSSTATGGSFATGGAVGSGGTPAGAGDAAPAATGGSPRGSGGATSGVGGSASAGASGTGGAPGGSSGTTSEAKSSGCSCRTLGRAAQPTGFGLFVVAALLAWRRRRWWVG